MSASVELSRVSRRFGEVHAVADVSLEVRAGEFLTLLGPSGCGKTTLLRMIAGFEPPDAGAVRIGGVDVTQAPPYRRDVNQVFQSYALFPHLSVWDNIAFGVRRQGLSASAVRQRVAEAVALVSLGGCERRKPHQLSGGQRQRVALARALAPRPAVLLLDEPLSALDAQLRAAMQFELKRLQRQLGTTFILVTHDQEEALTMSDRVALMQAGRIEQLADAATLYHRPASVFAATFVGETNLIPAERLERGESRVRVRVADGGELQVPAAAWPGDAARVLLSIRPEALRLEGSGDGANAIPATFQERIFRGATQLWRLTLRGGLDVRVIGLVNTGAALLQPGDQVVLTVRPEDIVVLAR